MFSCSQQEEYLNHESGLKYYFLVRNDSGNYAKEGDILTLKLSYRTANDSVIFDSNEIDTHYRMQFTERSHKGGCLEDAWSLMRVGDSLRCKINAFDFYRETRKIEFPENLDPTEDLIFDIKLMGIQSYSEIAKERQDAKHNSLEAEMLLLEDYLERTNVDIEPTNSGLYFVSTKEGLGDFPKNGQKVAIHYVAKKIDMSIFDSSYNREEPLIFTIGSQSVIPGLEEGVLSMKENGKARIIVPSFLAYAETGYGSLIGPFATLIFEVELIKIMP